MAYDSYTTQKIHPVTGKFTDCQVFLNYFDNHDGFKFKDERVIYTKEELEALTPTPDG